MLRNLRNAAAVPVRQEHPVRREYLGGFNSPEELVVYILKGIKLYSLDTNWKSLDMEDDGS